MKNYIIQIQQDYETGLYIGIVPGIPCAHTQAATLEELKYNLLEVTKLCIEEKRSQDALEL